MIPFLFYFLVSLFPLGIIPRISYFTISVTLQDIIVILILLLSLPLILRTINLKNKFVVLYLMFIFISIVGLITHTHTFFEFLASFAYLLRLTSYILLIIPLMNLLSNQKRFLILELIFSGFIFVFFGYIQYFYYPSLRNLYYLGWDEHLYRLFSTFLDPNFAGGFIVLIIFLYSFFFFNYFYNAGIKLRILFIAGYLFLVPSLLLTYSRSSFISFIVAFIIFLMLIDKKRLLLVFFLAFLLSFIFLPKNLGGEGVKLLRTASITARLNEYQNALAIFSQNSVLGIGYNSLRFVSLEYGFLSRKDFLSSHAGSGVPNSFLLILVTSGMVGFFVFVDFIFNILKRILIIMKNKKFTPLSFSVFSSFIAILISSLFENTLLYAPIMLWLVIITGILFSEKIRGGN